MSAVPGVDAFFPDGTECHSEFKGGKERKYYCQRHAASAAATCTPDNGGRGGRSGAGEAYVVVDPPTALDGNGRDADADRYFELDEAGNRVETGQRPAAAAGEGGGGFKLDHDTLPLPKEHKKKG